MPAIDAARHCMSALALKDEGTARNAAKKDGKYYDLHLMSILRSEFFDEN